MGRGAPTLADLIGSSGGGGFLKGGSPVPPLVQTMNALSLFVEEHLRDGSGALRAVLKRTIRSSEPVVGAHMRDPLGALEVLLSRFLERDAALQELVREVDVEWGRIMEERPYFQHPGQAAHPEDEYTHESVRTQLEALQALVKRQRERA